jgi:ketosteroid isomerase-like protein
MSGATSNPESLVRHYYECLNAHALADALALFAPDAQLRAAGARPRDGVEEIADFLERAFAPYSEHRDEITRLLVTGATVIAELTFTGRLENGATISFDALTVFDLDGERIATVSNWTDTHTVRASLAEALAEGDSAG